MKKTKYHLELLSPAFAGNAAQDAQWRTPPIKAEIRSWWRMLASAQLGSWQAVQQVERDLLGHAGSREHTVRSKLLLRLDRWESGKATSLPPSRERLFPHGKNSMDAAAYLGYGRVDLKGNVIAGDGANTMLNAGQSVGLQLAWPENACGAEWLEQSVALMGAFGAIGGRSRNGFGALHVPDAAPLTSVPLLDYQAALEASHVQGIGQDERGPLIWWSRKSYDDWNGTFSQFARIRSGLRKTHGDRALLLAAPGQKRRLPGLETNQRIPNSLRMRPARDPAGKLRAMIFHVPLRPADEIWLKLEGRTRNALPALWRAVHAELDQDPALERAGRFWEASA